MGAAKSLSYDYVCFDFANVQVIFNDIFDIRYGGDCYGVKRDKRKHKRGNALSSHAGRKVYRN